MHARRVTRPKIARNARVLGRSGGLPGRASGGNLGRAGALALGALGVILAAGAPGGCASYVNLPQPESSTVAVKNPNARQPRAVMAKSFEVVSTVYPPGPEGTPFAIELPGGLTDESVAWIMSKQAPTARVAGRSGAVSPSTTPTYRLGRVWIRSGKAKVDVFRPVIELPRRPDGTYQHQAITVWLEGGLDPWRVTRLQKWAIGAFPRPGVVDSYGDPSGEEAGGAVWNDPTPTTPRTEPMEGDPDPFAVEQTPGDDAPDSWRSEPVPATRTAPEPKPIAEPASEPVSPPTSTPRAEPAGDQPWFRVEPIGGG